MGVGVVRVAAKAQATTGAEQSIKASVRFMVSPGVRIVIVGLLGVLILLID
jgi:hypothetical protein